MSDLFDVTGRTALVTGGSRGIGFMVARGLVDAGAEVVISARKAAQCEAAAAELGCRAIVADVSSKAGAAALAAQIDGPLDILVNNAGATWGAPLEDFPEDGFDKVLDTNVKGPFFLTGALLPRLRATTAPPARVINIGSVDGIRVPVMESYPYSASKAAIHQLTRHLAKRLAGERITVNAIAPGPFPSKMMAFLLDDPEAAQAVADSVPLGRVGEPDDVSGTVRFLCSRAGAYVTGVVLPLDGGITAAAT